MSVAGPQPGRHREHHLGVQTGTASGSQQFLSLLKGQALSGPACPSGRSLDQGRHVPANQVPDFGVSDGPLQAETGDLKAARVESRPARVSWTSAAVRPFGSLSTLRY
jgi:hypothetical protein